MNASEARKIATERREIFIKANIDSVLNDVRKRVEKGEFYTDWNYICPETKNKLEEMGYSVKKAGSDNYPNSESYYRISW